MFKIVTKFYCTISSDMVRCFGILWLNSQSFKIIYFIISTFTFITDHLNCIYSLLTSLHHHRSSTYCTILHEISISYRTKKIIPFINTSTMLTINIQIWVYLKWPPHKTNHSTFITLYSVANNESQKFSSWQPNFPNCHCPLQLCSVRVKPHCHHIIVIGIFFLLNKGIWYFKPQYIVA